MTNLRDETLQAPHTLWIGPECGNCNDNQETAMNNNCLEGIKCPSCGSEGPFIIEVKTQVMMYDSGSDIYTSDIHWDGDAYMRCDSCDEDGPVKHFRTTTTTE